jgi:hypothetical protein
MQPLVSAEVLRAVYEEFPQLYWENLAARLLALVKGPDASILERLHALVHNGCMHLDIKAPELAQFFDTYFLWVFQAAPDVKPAFMDFADVLSTSLCDERRSWKQYSYVLQQTDLLELKRSPFLKEEDDY